MAETIKTAVAAAPHFGDDVSTSVMLRLRLTLPELDAISEAVHAMRVGEIEAEADTPARTEALRALLASADAKILAMREAKRRRLTMDLEIDAALVAIDAALEACTDGPFAPYSPPPKGYTS